MPHLARIHAQMSSSNDQQDQKKDQKNPYQQTVEELLATLATDAHSGLSEEEAHARLAQYGRNELAAERPVPGWKKFLAQFQNVLVILLLVATAISTGLWLYEQESSWPYEATAIFAVVLLNAIMGYIQESRAEEAVAALRQMSAAHANVVRDGNQQRASRRLSWCRATSSLLKKAIPFPPMHG